METKEQLEADLVVTCRICLKKRGDLQAHTARGFYEMEKEINAYTQEIGGYSDARIVGQDGYTSFSFNSRLPTKEARQLYLEAEAKARQANDVAQKARRNLYTTGRELTDKERTRLELIVGKDRGSKLIPVRLGKGVTHGYLPEGKVTLCWKKIPFTESRHYGEEQKEE